MCGRIIEGRFCDVMLQRKFYISATGKLNLTRQIWYSLAVKNRLFYIQFWSGSRWLGGWKRLSCRCCCWGFSAIVKFCPARKWSYITASFLPRIINLFLTISDIDLRRANRKVYFCGFNFHLNPNGSLVGPR